MRTVEIKTNSRKHKDNTTQWPVILQTSSVNVCSGRGHAILLGGHCTEQKRVLRFKISESWVWILSLFISAIRLWTMNFSALSLPHEDNGDNNESTFPYSTGAGTLSVHLRWQNQHEVRTQRVASCLWLLLFSQQKLVLDIFSYDAMQTSASPCFRHA